MVLLLGAAFLAVPAALNGLAVIPLILGGRALRNLAKS